MKYLSVIGVSLLFSSFVFSQNSLESKSLLKSPLPAEDVVQIACKQAAKENKNVLIIFHASWCIWCHRMDSSMNDASCKKFFDDNFVTTHLVVLESKGKEYLQNPGGIELMTKYGGAEQGIPFWVVLDKNGKVIADCFMKADSPNEKPTMIGCPATEKEVEAFINVLRKTTKINSAQEAAIIKRFRQNDQQH